MIRKICPRCSHEHDPEYICELDCVPCAIATFGPDGGGLLEEREAENKPISTFPCRDCGAEIEHWSPGCDEVCDVCGALHNAFGQRLNDDAPFVGPNGMSPTGWDD